jgi:hypothetical protein
VPWTRSGDTALTYPKLMQVAGLANGGDPIQLVNEVAGWIWRCAGQSSAHLTDYRIDMGTAWTLGGARTPVLSDVAVRVGLMRTDQEDGFDYLVLLQDPDFIHILLREEVNARRQHDRDAKNHDIRVPMLLRDGDQCRYCLKQVTWYGPISPRRGTMDHLDPNKTTPTSVDDVVVACQSCNSGRRDGREDWERAHPLQPAPLAPLYGAATAKYLTERGHPTQANLADQQRPQRGSSADTAPRQGVRPAAQHAAGSGSSAGAGDPSGTTSPALSPDSHGRKSPLPGKGRDGTGSGMGREGVVVGPGRDVQGMAGQPLASGGSGSQGASGKRRRGGRGRRKGK